MRALPGVVAAAMMAFSPWAPLVAAEDGDKAANPILASYDKGFRFASADGAFSLRINGMLQTRWTYVDYDPAIRYNEDDYSNFYIRRARLYFTGHTGSPRLTYYIHIQLEPSQQTNAHDLWVEWEFSDLLRLGVGRNKIAYGL
jgi:hypothetical protein